MDAKHKSNKNDWTHKKISKETRATCRSRSRSTKKNGGNYRRTGLHRKDANQHARAAPPRKIRAYSLHRPPKQPQRRGENSAFQREESVRRCEARTRGNQPVLSAPTSKNPHAMGPGQIQTNMQSLYVEDEKLCVCIHIARYYGKAEHRVQVED